MRFFLSYRRRCEVDRGLADDLRRGLVAAGHEVFIDIGMPVGIDWAHEIAQRIDWCDFLVVLLSTESVQGEMVQGEVRLAHQRRKADGRPRILPIRVRFDGPLDYELDSYLARIQYLLWSGPDDTAAILTALTVANQDGSELTTSSVSSAFPAASGRPLPSADPRQLQRPPGGTIRTGDPFYIRRHSDELVNNLSGTVGETLIIKGPRQVGKSSLLIRYLDACRQAGKRFVFIDFQSLAETELVDYSTFLSRLATALMRGLRLEAVTMPAFSSSQPFTFFIEDEVISRIDNPFTIALDEADRILGRPYQRDFFAMLRSWHNARAEPLSPWERVDLALVISTEPYVLIDRADQSPFNVTPPVEPQPFPREALDTLDEWYGTGLGRSKLEQLLELLNGHPYLTRLAFYRIVTGGVADLEALLEHAPKPEGPFGDHLRVSPTWPASSCR